jgi:hypothetical protein
LRSAVSTSSIIFEARPVAFARMMAEQVDPVVGQVAGVHQPVEQPVRIAPAEQDPHRRLP